LVARLVLTLPLAAAVVPACLGDLDPPTDCPAPAATPDCLVLPEPTQIGCLGEAELGCFTSSCACEGAACAPGTDSCYPEGDCPAAVLLEHPDAVCSRIASDAFGDFGVIDPGGYCVCGCVECLRVCDGKGPIIAVVNAGDYFDVADFPFPLVAVGDAMPDSGSAGVYVRVRGSSVPFFTLLYAESDAAPAEIDLAASYPIIVLPNDGFVERVGYRDLGTGEPYRWSDAGRQPLFVGFLPNVDPDPESLSPLPQLMVVEIDCIVPFYLAGE
jgi:hypothetical protein